MFFLSEEDQSKRNLSALRRPPSFREDLFLGNRLNRTASPPNPFRRPATTRLLETHIASNAILSAIPATTEERSAITNSPIFATVVSPERRRSRRLRRRSSLLWLRSTTARRSSDRSRSLGPTVVPFCCYTFLTHRPLTAGRHLTSRPPFSLSAPEG